MLIMDTDMPWAIGRNPTPDKYSIKDIRIEYEKGRIHREVDGKLDVLTSDRSIAKSGCNAA